LWEKQTFFFRKTTLAMMSSAMATIMGSSENTLVTTL
jgi:hypothetical protein